MKGPGRRKRRQPEGVVASLRQADETLAAGKPIARVARSLGGSPVTLRRRRREYGSADRDAIRRLKELGEENARLERLVSRIRELAVLNARRGRRHVMDLLHQECGTIEMRLIKRLWPAEGLLVPQERRNGRRIGTGEYGIVR